MDIVKDKLDRQELILNQIQTIMKNQIKNKEILKQNNLTSIHLVMWYKHLMRIK